MATLDERLAEKGTAQLMVVILLSYFYLGICAAAIWMFLDVRSAIALSFFAIFVHRIIGEQSIYVHNRLLDAQILSLRNSVAITLHILNQSAPGPQTPVRDFGGALSQADIGVCPTNNTLNLPITSHLQEPFIRLLSGVAVEIGILATCAYCGWQLKPYSDKVAMWIDASIR